MKIILDDAQYSYVAATKVITLVAPYDSLSLGQIISIRNLTRGEEIYNDTIRLYPVSISGADITHTASNDSHSNSDILQIVLDVGGSASTAIHVSSGLRGNVIQDIAILAHQAVAHPATVKGTAQDVSTALKATIILFHASVEAVANTNPGKFLIQISGSAQGNEDWATIFEFDATISTADTEAMLATEPIGETALSVAATAGFVANDILYVQDASVVVDGEWARCEKIVTDTTVDLVDGLTTQKDSSDMLWNDADIFTCALDLEAVSRTRVIFQHEGAAGVNCHVKGLMITGDYSG